MTVENHRIEDFIPHRGRMLLVEELIEASDKRGTVRTRVASTWPLCKNGRVDPVVLIEVVAQSAAALVGWRMRHQQKMGGRGFLVGVRRTELTLVDLPVGTELTTRIEVDYELQNYAVFKGRVFAGDEQLAEVEIQTFRPDDDFEPTSGEMP